jgi:hypothetical protein
MHHRLLLALALVLGSTLPATTSGATPRSQNDTFDRDAAVAALSSVDVQACKRAKGPTGGGHVVVTFGSSGTATTAAVDKAPYVGTAVGQCIAKKYKQAKVPAFQGVPVTVGKTFKID